MNEIDVAVIGGGVVGLACALEARGIGRRACASSSANRGPGRGMSTHNSGVIHAGIYYPAGSLKARLCIEGRERLYEFCERHGVPHQRCGKLLVARDEGEIAELEALRARGIANGVTSLEMVDAAFRAAPRTSRACRRGRLVAGHRHHRSRSADQRRSAGSAATRRRDARGHAVIGAAAVNGGIELVTPHERFLRARW